MCGIVRKSVWKHISVRKCSGFYGNRWQKKLFTEIWFELASQLDLKWGENLKNLKNYCKKLLVELKYKTKDNLMPN